VNGGTYNDVGSAIGAVQSGIALSNRFFAADGAPGTPGALALGIDSTAIGNESIARGDESAALGSGSTANGYGATAVGSGATTGNNSPNSGNYGTAVGFNSVASGEQSSAFGYSASATGAGSTAIGAGAVATRANQIALGTASSTYTAAGISSTASRAAQSGQTQFITTDSNGNLASSAYGPQDIAGLNNSITGLTNSVGILGANVAALSNRVDGNQREARQGIAMAAAMAQAPMPSVAGKTTWKVNNSYYKNYGASSLSVAHRLPTNVPMALTAGVAVGFRSSALFTAGLQGEF
jgi:autotransporter adhesin